MEWVCKHCVELNNELDPVCFNCGKEEKKNEDQIRFMNLILKMSKY